MEDQVIRRLKDEKQDGDRPLSSYEITLQIQKEPTEKAEIVVVESGSEENGETDPSQNVHEFTQEQTEHITQEIDEAFAVINEEKEEGSSSSSSSSSSSEEENEDKKETKNKDVAGDTALQVPIVTPQINNEDPEVVNESIDPVLVDQVKTGDADVSETKQPCFQKNELELELKDDFQQDPVSPLLPSPPEDDNYAATGAPLPPPESLPLEEYKTQSNNDSIPPPLPEEVIGTVESLPPSLTPSPEEIEDLPVAAKDEEVIAPPPPEESLTSNTQVSVQSDLPSPPSIVEDASPPPPEEPLTLKTQVSVQSDLPSPPSIGEEASLGTEFAELPPPPMEEEQIIVQNADKSEEQVSEKQEKRKSNSASSSSSSSSSDDEHENTKVASAIQAVAENEMESKKNEETGEKTEVEEEKGETQKGEKSVEAEEEKREMQEEEKPSPTMKKDEEIKDPDNKDEPQQQETEQNQQATPDDKDTKSQEDAVQNTDVQMQKDNHVEQTESLQSGAQNKDEAKPDDKNEKTDTNQQKTGSAITPDTELADVPLEEPAANDAVPSKREPIEGGDKTKKGCCVIL